jgi:hypothetical protein
MDSQNFFLEPLQADLALDFSTNLEGISGLEFYPTALGERQYADYNNAA